MLASFSSHPIQRVQLYVIICHTQAKRTFRYFPIQLSQIKPDPFEEAE